MQLKSSGQLDKNRILLGQLAAQFESILDQDAKHWIEQYAYIDLQKVGTKVVEIWTNEK